MFLVLLRFSNEGAAPDHLEGHQAWVKRGFDEGVFVLAGSIEPGLGGAVVAHDTSLHELGRRVKDDPFVAEGVVKAEVVEISPGMTDERLQFLRA